MYFFKISILLFFLIYFASAFLCFGASFDCSKAGTAVEKMICSDDKLSDLDSEMSSIYKIVREFVDDKNKLKSDQINWIKNSRNICLNAQCLNDVYTERIGYLRSLQKVNSYQATAHNNYSEQHSDISWDEIDQIFDPKGRATDLQKKEAWKKYKGKSVKWRGWVVEVKDAIFGLQLFIQMDLTSIFNDVRVTLKSTERDKAISLAQGDIVVFCGKMSDWGSVEEIFLSEGIILDIKKK